MGFIDCDRCYPMVSTDLHQLLSGNTHFTFSVSKNVYSTGLHTVVQRMWLLLPNNYTMYFLWCIWSVIGVTTWYVEVRINFWVVTLTWRFQLARTYIGLVYAVISRIWLLLPSNHTMSFLWCFMTLIGVTTWYVLTCINFWVVTLTLRFQLARMYIRQVYTL